MGNTPLKSVENNIIKRKPTSNAGRPPPPSQSPKEEAGWQHCDHDVSTCKKNMQRNLCLLEPRSRPTCNTCLCMLLPNPPDSRKCKARHNNPILKDPCYKTLTDADQSYFEQETWNHPHQHWDPRPNIQHLMTNTNHLKQMRNTCQYIVYTIRHKKNKDVNEKYTITVDSDSPQSDQKHIIRLKNKKRKRVALGSFVKKEYNGKQIWMYSSDGIDKRYNIFYKRYNKIQQPPVFTPPPGPYMYYEYNLGVVVNTMKNSVKNVKGKWKPIKNKFVVASKNERELLKQPRSVIVGLLDVIFVGDYMITCIRTKPNKPTHEDVELLNAHLRASTEQRILQAQSESADQQRIATTQRIQSYQQMQQRRHENHQLREEVSRKKALSNRADLEVQRQKQVFEQQQAEQQLMELMEMLNLLMYLWKLYEKVQQGGQQEAPQQAAAQQAAAQQAAAQQAAAQQEAPQQEAQQQVQQQAQQVQQQAQQVQQQVQQQAQQQAHQAQQVQQVQQQVQQQQVQQQVQQQNQQVQQVQQVHLASE